MRRGWTIVTVLASSIAGSEGQPAGAATFANAEAALSMVGPDQVVDTGVHRSERASTVALSAGAQTIEARFAGIRSDDSDPGGSPQTYEDTINFDVAFDVQASSDEFWELGVQSVISAGLTVVQEGVNQHGLASLLELAPSLSCTASGDAQCGFMEITSGGLDSVVTDHVPYGLEASMSIVGTGPQSLQLRFQYQLLVRSEGSEASIRFGIPGTLAGMTADDYPGVGNRDPADDGHFVTITVVGGPTPVPTVGPAGVVALGALVLAIGGRTLLRRRLAV